MSLNSVTVLSGDLKRFACVSGTQAGCPHPSRCPLLSQPCEDSCLAGVAAAPLASPCPPCGSHFQAGDTQALGTVQPPSHLVNYFV